MSCEVNCCTFLRGELYIGEARSHCDGSIKSLLGCGGVKPMRPLGNVERANVFIESEIRGLTTKTNAFETLSCGQTIVNNVRIQIQLNCTNGENLKQALYGDQTTGTDSGTEQMSLCGGFYESCSYIRFKKSGVTSVTVEIKDVLGNVVDTLVEGEDFKKDLSGIELLTSLSINENNSLFISYEYDDSTFKTTSALVQVPTRKSLYLRGVNTVHNTAYNIEIFDVILQPATQLELISTDNFQSFELNGVIMKDCSKGDGLSQYLEIKEEIGVGCA